MFWIWGWGLLNWRVQYWHLKWLVCHVGHSAQILSLSIENCLKPKYEYLVKELQGGPHTVTSFPAYFSLSLEQRIKPRHRFLVALKRLPTGPFPMKSLAVTDSCFCKQWAKTSLEEYQTFRNELLLGDFAKKFEWKNKVHIWQNSLVFVILSNSSCSGVNAFSSVLIVWFTHVNM